MALMSFGSASLGHNDIIAKGAILASEMHAVLPTACPTLPSALSAHRLLVGDPWAIFAVVRDVLFRAVLIGTGMWIVGARDNLALNAIAGSVAIETFVLGYLSLNGSSTVAA